MDASDTNTEDTSGSPPSTRVGDTKDTTEAPVSTYVSTNTEETPASTRNTPPPSSTGNDGGSSTVGVVVGVVLGVGVVLVLVVLVIIVLITVIQRKSPVKLQINSGTTQSYNNEAYGIGEGCDEYTHFNSEHSQTRHLVEVVHTTS